MSKPEMKVTKLVEIPGMYGGSIVPKEIIINKGRLPRSEKGALSRRERKKLKDKITRPDLIAGIHEVSREVPEGTLFTFNPNETGK